MIDLLEQINLRFFKLFGELYENVEFLSNESYKFMEHVLFNTYKTEVDKFLLDKQLNDKKDFYELRKRVKNLTPSGILFFKNKAKILTNEKLGKEFKKYFEDFKASFKQIQEEQSLKYEKQEEKQEQKQEQK